MRQLTSEELDLLKILKSEIATEEEKAAAIQRLKEIDEEIKKENPIEI
ncbi:MAG: hypothetical protein J6M90_00530 [Oscillospiraceae bacterium]|nr:hypothetical protein [Oscillospiraceae bacterium]